MIHVGNYLSRKIILGWPKSVLGFFITSYRRIQMNFLANPIFIYIHITSNILKCTLPLFLLFVFFTLNLISFICIIKIMFYMYVWFFLGGAISLTFIFNLVHFFCTMPRIVYFSSLISLLVKNFNPLILG